MAKKKEDTSKPLKQTTTTYGQPVAKTDWYAKAYGAAKGGGGEGGGYTSTGYTVNWSGIDFGKQALKDKMNKSSYPGTDDDPGGKKKRCARKGGYWNEETGRCEDSPPEKKDTEKKETYKDDVAKRKKDCAQRKFDGENVRWDEENQMCVEDDGSGECDCDPDTDLPDCDDCPPTDEECDCDNFDPELSDENDPCYEKCAGTGGDEGPCKGKEEEKEMCAAGDYGDGMVWNNDTCECEEDPNKGSGSDPKPKRDDIEPKDPQDLDLEKKKGGKDDLLINEIKNMRASELNQGLDMNRITPAGGQQLNKNLAVLSDPETHSGNINGTSGRIIENVNSNDYVSTLLGGGDIKNKKQKYNFKRGKLTGQTNSGKGWTERNYDKGSLHRPAAKNKRVNFNWSFEITGKGEISFHQMTGYSKKVWGNITKGLGVGVDIKDGKATMTKQEWDKFTKVYNKTIKKLIKRRDEFAKDYDKGQPNWYATGKFKPWERDLLRMHAQGFFANNFGKEEPPTQFRSPIKDTTRGPAIKGNHNYAHIMHDQGKGPDPHAEDKPAPKFRSPFARRDRSHLRVRDNWMPTPMKHGTFEDFQYGRNGHNPDTMSAKHEDWHLKQSGESPNNYNSPFHQEQQMQQPTNIWEKIQAYGKDMDKRINKFIQHTNYDPATDKPINSFQNQTWVGIITEWLQEQKQKMVDAGNKNDKQTQQNVSTAVNQLIQDVTTYSGKFLDWIDRNSGNQAEGDAGGSVTSKGSRKDEKFIGDVTFMGDQNTTIAVGDDGKIGIKAHGLEDVKYVEDLDTDVFAKDDAGYQMFLEASGQLQKDAESGKPMNSSIIEGHADNLLKNEDSILSWAFDPMYGQSWIQDYVQANPDGDIDMFMPESDRFDLDYLTDELHGWLTSKLTEAYDKNKPQQPEQKGDVAQGIMDQTLASIEEEKKNKEGVYAEKEQEGAVEEQVVAQQSPLGYREKSLAMKLLNKYAK